MAAGRILLPCMPALDSNGRPVSGALLNFYQNGTTTRKAVYTAADLATPLSNPVVADSAGAFPSIFADPDELYSVTCFSPAGVMLPKASYTNVRATTAIGDGLVVVSSYMQGLLDDEDASEALTTLELLGPADYAITDSEGVVNTGSNLMIRRGNDAAGSTNIDPMVYIQNIEAENNEKRIDSIVGIPARDYATGLPFPGAKLYAYVTGTNTPQNIYSDAACTQVITQPVVADASGQFPKMFASDPDTYRIKVTTADGALINQVDNVVAASPLRRPVYICAVRPSTAVGFSQSVFTHTEDYATDAGVQSVSMGAAMHLVGAGAGWGGYFIAITRNPLNRPVGLEVDVGNSSGVDHVYNPADPVGETVPHSKGVWTYLLGGKNASIAEGVGAGSGVQWCVGKYYALQSIRTMLMDIQASPPVGLYFRNGASVNGLGVTQGGVGIDFGPNAKGYGAGADQGCMHVHSHPIVFGASVAEGGTGNNYMKASPSGNQFGYYFAGIEAWRFTATSFAPVTNATGVVGSATEGLLRVYMSSGGTIRVGANDVVGSRKTGWGAPTGTATRSSFDTATVTLPQLAERLKALLDDLTTHGLVGA